MGDTDRVAGSDEELWRGRSRVKLDWLSDVTRQCLVFAREQIAAPLCAALQGCVRVTSRAELIAALASRVPIAAFVDFDLVPQIEGETGGVPIVGITIDDTLSGTVRSLTAFPWLSHLVTGAMVSTPFARSHLAMLLERLQHGPEFHVVGDAGTGRVALLTSSVRRDDRFERMREFFATHGASAKTIAASSDVAEELVTNALYDAPLEAGYFASAVPRTQDVELPPEHACEISYGVENGSVFVRIRDPFGALTRSRMLGVLNRCNSTNVSLDESRGGAGLGLWRVFSAATAISITVIPGRLTDILVRIENKKGRPVKQTHAVHLFFPEPRDPLDGVFSRFAADHDSDLMDESFTGLYVA